jgi:hypothetical protein
LPRRKKEQPKPWSEDQWHMIDSKLSFLKFQSLDSMSKDTGIPADLIKLIIEDFVKDPFTITRRGKSYRYYNALLDD